MRNFKLYLMVLSFALVSCQPSLYISIENHTSGTVRMDILFSAPNDYWKIKGPDLKSVELTSAVINSAVEFNFGSGSWTDDKLLQLIEGIDQILVTTGGGISKIEEEAALIDFFKKRIIGKNKNGIRIVIQ